MLNSTEMMAKSFPALYGPQTKAQLKKGAHPTQKPLQKTTKAFGGDFLISVVGRVIFALAQTGGARRWQK
ncbi:MAG: hypothetical protein ACLVJB_11505 [Christensenellales bacterium]